MIEDLKRQGWAISSPFSTASIKSLNLQAENLFQTNQMKSAQIGQGLSKKENKSIRSDLIHWVDQWSEIESLREFSLFIENLKKEFSKNLFLQLKRYEGYFAAYPKGSFYKRHLDVHRDSHRKLTFVLYLSAWQAHDGGELALYSLNNELVTKIEPRQGSFLCFNSAEFIHEVLPTQKLRLSLTGWLRDDEVFLF